MDQEEAKAKLLAVQKELGREIRVFTNTIGTGKQEEVSASSADEPDDDFYEFTPEDYYRIMSGKIGAQAQVLKTQKMREAEAAARRTKITKAVIRVRFPDNYVLEAKFQSTEKIQCLIDLLMKVVARPDLPFYIYTTPPKERVKDTSNDFYSAGFVPGAIVYFSYDLPKDVEFNCVPTKEGLPYLRDDILLLNGVELTSVQVDPVHPEQEPKLVVTPAPDVDPSPPAKKQTKPKWLRL